MKIKETLPQGTWKLLWEITKGVEEAAMAPDDAPDEEIADWAAWQQPCSILPESCTDRSAFMPNPYGRIGGDLPADPTRFAWCDLANPDLGDHHRATETDPFSDVSQEQLSERQRAVIKRDQRNTSAANALVRRGYRKDYQPEDTRRVGRPIVVCTDCQRPTTDNRRTGSGTVYCHVCADRRVAQWQARQAKAPAPAAAPRPAQPRPADAPRYTIRYHAGHQGWMVVDTLTRRYANRQGLDRAVATRIADHANAAWDAQRLRELLS